MIPALIGALGGLATSALGISMQSRANEQAWQRANEYNEPKAYIQRLRDAGVNPASALYGSKVLESSTEPMATPDFPAALSAGSQSAVNALSMSNLKKQNKLLDEQIEGVKQDNISKSYDNMVKQHEAQQRGVEQMSIEDLYVGFDENGDVVYGNLSSDGAFEPVFSKDGSYVGKRKTPDSDYPVINYPAYRAYRDAIQSGFVVSKDLYDSRISEVQDALQREFGRSNAQAIINELNSRAAESGENARSLRIDNDVFENLQFGKGNAKAATDAVKILFSVLKGKK